MIELELASVLAAAVAAPHLLPLHRVPPMGAASVWLLVLALRALVAIGGVLFVFLYLPQTGVFEAIADWCLHQVLPVLATHLGLSGHPLAHAALVLPALALAASLLWLSFGLVRAWLALRRQLRHSLGRGPWGSTVVADERIVVAATALGRAQIVLSPAALDNLDEQELRASMAHEFAHLRRRHRPLLLVGSLLAALARLLPATRAAERELVFHLERDADQFAVRTTRDPLALASAICKAAGSATSPALAALGGRGRVSRRLDILVDGERPRSRSLESLVAGLAVLLAAGVLSLAVTLPSWALSAPPAAPVVGSADCSH